jgi:peptide/nickel transport system permease protein
MGALRNLVRSRAGLLGALIVVVFVLVALAASYLAPFDPLQMNLRARFTPPTWWPAARYSLGGDQLGRDILSRIIVGSRITLAVATIAVVAGGTLGILLGLVAGYFGGWTDRIIMRLADIQLSIPLMLFALIVIAALGASLPNLIGVLALTGWTRYARVVRGEVLSLREREFVLMARAAGARGPRILWWHILPNVMTAAIVVATLELARVVILESGLSFLGLGVQPPNASWGRMLAEGRGYIASAWWLSTFPGVAIVLVVLGVNLLGDWMRDYFDPKLSGTR